MKFINLYLKYIYILYPERHGCMAENLIKQQIHNELNKNKNNFDHIMFVRQYYKIKYISLYLYNTIIYTFQYNENIELNYFY